MKKIVLIVVCVMLAAVTLTGCISVHPPMVWGNGIAGRGAMETYSIEVGQFTEVRVELLCDILYSAAPSDQVTLEIQPNLMKYVVVETSGGVLTVRAKRNIYWTNASETPVLNISTPTLSKVSHAGAGSFRTIDPIVADAFTLNITGAANGKAELDVDKLTVRLTGAGDINLSGKADVTDMNIAGAGKLDALELQTRNSSINLAGVGTVRVNCTGNLNIVAGGVGTVEYKGSPTIDLTRGGLVTLKSV